MNDWFISTLYVFIHVWFFYSWHFLNIWTFYIGTNCIYFHQFYRFDFKSWNSRSVTLASVSSFLSGHNMVKDITVVETNYTDYAMVLKHKVFNREYTQVALYGETHSQMLLNMWAVAVLSPVHYMWASARVCRSWSERQAWDNTEV